MIFPILTAIASTAAAARQGISFRPPNTIARLADSLSTTDRMTFLKDASSVVDNILLQAGNATEHLEAADTELLGQVIRLIEGDMYGSMKDSHDGDAQNLADTIADISACNAEITARQSATGDLGLIHQEAIKLQIELDRLQGVVDEKTSDNDTKWDEFENHMRIISDPPPCPEFPNPRGMAAFDVYFERSPYSAWWTAARKPYHEHKRRWEAAHEALKQAISAYDIHKGQRDVKYCDYKNELEAACAAFNLCYTTKVDYYTNTLVPRVKIEMNQRIEVCKVGQTLLAQVRFLLADEKTSETPEFSTSRFEVNFPEVPAKEVCDLSPLTVSSWNPPVTCESTDLNRKAFAFNPGASNACPDGYSKFKTEEACRSALAGEPWARFQPSLSLDTVPGGCYKIDQGDTSDIYFNRHTGIGATGNTLICRPEATRTPKCSSICQQNENKPWHGNNGRSKCSWSRCIDCPECSGDKAPDRHGENCGAPCQQWLKKGGVCDWCGLHEGQAQHCCRVGYSDPGCDAAIGSHPHHHSCVTVPKR